MNLSFYYSESAVKSHWFLRLILFFYSVSHLNSLPWILLFQKRGLYINENICLYKKKKKRKEKKEAYKTLSSITGIRLLTSTLNEDILFFYPLALHYPRKNFLFY